MGEAMRRRRAWWLIGSALALAAVLLFVRRIGSWAGRPAGQPTARGAAPPARPVPVQLATVSRRDVPIFLQGLGSVVANQTVTVRTQVDGRLQDVYFREGQLVRRGEVLAQIDPRPFQAQLDQAKGALERDLAQLHVARLNVERDRPLVAQKLIAQQQQDTDVALVGQLEGAVAIDRAAIESARLNLDYARITSPVDGVTGIRAVDAGNLVHATDTGGIVVVTQLDPVGVVFSLPQDDLGDVAAQLARAPLPVLVASRDGSVPLGQGTLSVIDNQINQATATLRLKATVPNPRRQLWPNQFVTVRLQLEVRRGALVMPVAAVQRGPSGTFAWVVSADQLAAQRPVKLERTEGELALVASGLDAGARVVVEGQGQLRPGTAVAARDAGGPGQGPAPPLARDGAQRGTGAGP
jgi:multidrug efflux system membrane fusion protein